ncbi:response regulator transcription factor [Streptomyces sp. AK02-04a]|uniref:response regulator transcription factor n=1 Tax=Streptomyces sp. AK02-04a TaxID=3028649 RepID=UPI0029BA5951|nr:LuxR C-terminal-related transcriptional regulator [Streptomyces sp. AK02-04a]MDX3763517.1 LuxR C-terminal-related transcriptional regulator [Streptomyces sp. AK02-04a]
MSSLNSGLACSQCQSYQFQVAALASYLRMTEAGLAAMSSVLAEMDGTRGESGGPSSGGQADVVPVLADSVAVRLTEQERRVLELLVMGSSNRAIGKALRISEHTVKNHVQSIFSKLDAHSRTEVAYLALSDERSTFSAGRSEPSA